MAINPADYPIRIKSNLWADQDHKKFYYRFMHDGKNKKGIFDFSDKSWDKRTRISKAELELLQIKEKLTKGLDDSATIDDIVKLYLDTLPEKNYKRDRKSYYDNKVKGVLGKKKAADVLPKDIQTLVNNLVTNTKGGSPRTVKQAIEVLSPSFEIAIANRLIIHNPCKAVKLQLPKSKKMVVNATERLKAIYQGIMKLYAADPYYRAFFLLALQGRRKGEVINLKWEHIAFDYDYYVLPDPKNGEEQKIFLPPNVKAALEEFQEKEGWIFESPVNPGQRLYDGTKQTARLKKEVGDWFSLHYTRNVMVSAMAEQGVDAIYMSGALGHSDPNTITKYLTMNYLTGSKIASNMIQHEAMQSNSREEIS
ncbi:MAG: tyrosine-type recombinase/integrase [Sulfuricurvum sp.]|nr:tyrosine-type recombinase/integrase [Sulfuricurvum sp.]